MEHRHLSLEEKNKLMPDVIIVLNMIRSFHEFGISCLAKRKALGYNDDQFLLLCCTTVAAGNNPIVSRKILFNIINTENDLFKRVKMSIQAGTTLMLQHPLKPQDRLVLSAIFSLSCIGLDFKNQFISNIKHHDENIYNLLFKNDDFNIS